MQTDIIDAVTCLSAHVARFARVDPPAHASRSRCSATGRPIRYEIHGTQKRVPPKHRVYFYTLIQVLYCSTVISMLREPRRCRRMYPVPWTCDTAPTSNILQYSIYCVYRVGTTARGVPRRPDGDSARDARPSSAQCSNVSVETHAHAVAATDDATTPTPRYVRAQRTVATALTTARYRSRHRTGC